MGTPPSTTPCRDFFVPTLPRIGCRRPILEGTRKCIGRYNYSVLPALFFSIPELYRFPFHGLPNEKVDLFYLSALSWRRSDGKNVGAWILATAAFYVLFYKPDEERRGALKGPEMAIEPSAQITSGKESQSDSNSKHY